MLKYIVEICVRIDIAILGIAYPIIISQISKIGDKFNSNYLPDIFRLEWVSKEINFKYFKLSFFELILISTIISFIFLVIDAEPWFGWDNIFINNSADLLTLVLTIILVTTFLIWTKKIVLFNGKPIELLKYLIYRYDNYQGNNSESKKYLIRSINDFAYYTIKTQDTHLQKILVNFYWDEFDKQRANYIELLSSLNDKENEYNELVTKGVEYSADLYDLIYRVSLESINSNNFLTRNIEYNSVSGWWLLGKGYEQVTTSELTYKLIWKILKMNLNTSENIKSYWSKAHQYGNYAFRVDPQYSFEDVIPLNQNEIDLKNNERIRFLEFNYTFGGLLLQQKKYQILNYIFNYSSSSPPNYVLLPQSINDIFYWFHRFSDRSNHRIEEIEVYFRFPDLDNYGVSYKVKYWICSYICLLYIRQFSLHKYLVYQNHTGMPSLSEDKIELNSMLQNIPYFRRCLKELFDNKDLLSEVNLEKIVNEKQIIIEKHLTDVETRIKNKLNYVEETKELSQSKIKLFNKSSVEILKQGLNKYNDILLNYDRNVIYEKTPKLVLNGAIDLMPKSSFVDDDIPHLNFDEALAKSILNRSLSRYIPNSFLIAKTESYLIYQENILSFIQQILNNKTEKEGIMIIGFNVDYRVKEIFDSKKINVKYFHSSQRNIGNVFYILDKKDLPRIYKKDINDKEVLKHKLDIISAELKLYSSVVEINCNNDLKSDWINAGFSKEDIDNEPKVQVALSFIWLLLLKKDRRIVQVKVSNPSLEQGVESNIDEVTPF